MSIIISKKGAVAEKIDRADFDKEDDLQQYIHENPESIPVYEIEADKKLLVVAREFPTESGPIDALAIDKDGDLYIVETKLYKNPDKRTVVAQALDYGASLWKHLNDFGEFIRMIDVEIQNKFHLSLEEKIKEFFGAEQAEIDLMLEKMKTNLKEGNIKFVILMDSMDERLKDLIIYVNQNSQFDIYAVQLEYYKFHEYEIMIPKLFGVEVKKNINNGSGKKLTPFTDELFLSNWSKSPYFQTAKEFLELCNSYPRYYSSRAITEKIQHDKTPSSLQIFFNWGLEKKYDDGEYFSDTFEIKASLDKNSAAYCIVYADSRRQEAVKKLISEIFETAVLRNEELKGKVGWVAKIPFEYLKISSIKEYFNKVGN